MKNKNHKIGIFLFCLVMFVPSLSFSFQSEFNETLFYTLPNDKGDFKKDKTYLEQIKEVFSQGSFFDLSFKEIEKYRFSGLWNFFSCHFKSAGIELKLVFHDPRPTKDSSLMRGTLKNIEMTSSQECKALAYFINRNLNFSNPEPFFEEALPYQEIYQELKFYADCKGNVLWWGFDIKDKIDLYKEIW